MKNAGGPPQQEGKLRVLVTGANGQLGRVVTERLAAAGRTAIGLSRQELDITDAAAVRRAFERFRPHAVIHAAAYTAVDRAESEPDEAYRTNAYGTRHVALAAAAVRAKLVYVSTDYVFDGRSREPYDEFAPTAPLNVYGRSKLAGEMFVRELHRQAFIVRTSWVYGRHGGNFVKTMLRLGRERTAVDVVDDQTGSPTLADDLAACLLRLVDTDRYGLYHVSGAGSCTWREFAQAVFDLGFGAGKAEARPVTTAQFPRPARRPAYSVLDHRALRLNGFPPMRDWREALAEFIAKHGRELLDGEP
ncbi:dTDP-4-dehydrorhamnose reductase [Paenibacillus thermoaerophilus]|nr:dTDP-4-dehydrorhamnose reductase [Paenibacillus thermoaerophilus]